MLLVEQLEARTLADRQAVLGAMLARGVKDFTGLPDPDDARDRFDELLAAEPVRMDPEQLELARALGVA